MWGKADGRACGEGEKLLQAGEGAEGTEESTPHHQPPPTAMSGPENRLLCPEAFGQGLQVGRRVSGVPAPPSLPSVERDWGAFRPVTRGPAYAGPPQTRPPSLPTLKASPPP